MNDQRRLKLIGQLLRLQDWELDAAKADAARARSLLADAQRALAAADEAISEVEAELRGSLSADGPLPLEAMMRTREHLRANHEARAAMFADQQRLDELSRKLAEQLKRRALAIQGLEKVRDRTSRVLAQDQEKKAAREVEELWVARRESRGRSSVRS